MKLSLRRHESLVPLGIWSDRNNAVYASTAHENSGRDSIVSQWSRRANIGALVRAVELTPVEPSRRFRSDSALHADGLSCITANASSSRSSNSAPHENPRDERARIVEALTRHQWRPNAAAQALGISRATLYRRIAKLGIVGPHRG